MKEPNLILVGVFSRDVAVPTPAHKTGRTSMGMLAPFRCVSLHPPLAQTTVAGAEQSPG